MRRRRGRIFGGKWDGSVKSEVVEQKMYRIEADTFMGVGVQGIAEFALQLKDLYETLSGEARLEEPYSVQDD